MPLICWIKTHILMGTNPIMVGINAIVVDNGWYKEYYVGYKPNNTEYKL